MHVLYISVCTLLTQSENVSIGYVGCLICPGKPGAAAKPLTQPNTQHRSNSTEFYEDEFFFCGCGFLNVHMYARDLSFSHLSNGLELDTELTTLEP